MMVFWHLFFAEKQQVAAAVSFFFLSFSPKERLILCDGGGSERTKPYRPRRRFSGTFGGVENPINLFHLYNFDRRPPGIQAGRAKSCYHRAFFPSQQYGVECSNGMSGGVDEPGILCARRRSFFSIKSIQLFCFMKHTVQSF